MPRIKSINQADADGTCLQGYVSVDYKTIVTKYGEPTTSDGYKIDAEWIIKWEDGQVGTLYNWKNGKNYLGDDGLPVEKIKEWNIGGRNNLVVKRIRDDLLNAWPIFDEIRQEASE
jgi:hypothetical protein